MIERPIFAPALPGDDESQPPLADTAPGRDPDDVLDDEPYVEPGGLVDIAIHELGGEVRAVESVPDPEP